MKNVNSVNINLTFNVDGVNTHCIEFLMARTTHPRPRKKPPKAYHHGNLRRALLDEALRTIQTQGVEHLTLRTVSERLGVSRSALYRHFADKQALLATVGKEGFRMLRQAIVDAWEQIGRAHV